MRVLFALFVVALTSCARVRVAGVPTPDSPLPQTVHVAPGSTLVLSNGERVRVGTTCVLVHIESWMTFLQLVERRIELLRSFDQQRWRWERGREHSQSF